MTNPRDYLADLLESMADADLTTSLDDEIVRIDPIESGPIVYDPENDPNYEPDAPGPVESPSGGEDIPIGGCWGTGHQHETDPGEGEVSIQPVEEAPAEDVYIEPDPEQEPGPEMSIQPVEEAPAIVEADVAIVS